MNYCTVSYTAAWWNWERWQRELDFMAMNSINMPLFTIGLDAVWYNTLLRFNFTDKEARAFLAGPGHAAWQWMQNLQSYGGPLPKTVIDKHAALGKKIISSIPQRILTSNAPGVVSKELPSWTLLIRCLPVWDVLSLKNRPDCLVHTEFMLPIRSTKVLLR